MCYIRTKVSSIREYGLAWELVNSEPMFSISVSGSDQVFGIRLKDKAIVSRDNISGRYFFLLVPNRVGFDFFFSI